jgi:hypothetical protein
MLINMKKALLLACAIPLAVVVYQTIFSECDQVLADPTGCCLQRDDPGVRNWHRNALDFAACEQLKRALDNDYNIFQESGHIWWNLRPDCSLP